MAEIAGGRRRCGQRSRWQRAGEGCRDRESTEGRGSESFHGYLPPLAATVDAFSFNLKNDSGTSNNVMLALAAAPVVLETADHDTKEKAHYLRHSL